MTMLLPSPALPAPRAWLECEVSRQVAGAISFVARLPQPGDALPLGRSCDVLVIESPFEPKLGEWRAPGRLVSAGWPRPRRERVELVISQCSRAAGELRVVPRSTHSRQWGARRQRRWFRLAQDAADVLAERLTSRHALPLDSRFIEKKELVHGVHS